MLTAHLRGLLKPGYKYGAKSIAAEAAILNAIEREYAAEITQSAAEASLALAGNSTAKNANDIAKNTHEQRTRAIKQRYHVPVPKEDEEPDLSRFDSLIKMYYALKEAGEL